MKKIIAVALAVCLVFSLSMVAFAAPAEEQREAIIQTSIEPTYLVSVPGDTTVNFNNTETTFGQIEIEKAQIDPDMCIVVALSTDGELVHTNEKEVLPYTIVDDATNEVFTSASYTDQGQTTDLSINIAASDWASAYAGAYSDTVTFTISYEARA